MRPLLATKDPYYISLAAVIYKTVNKDFADVLLQSSDEDSDYFKQISASWELGFNDFVLAVGSKNLKDAEIITDPKHINEMKHHLKAFEGAGKLDDGTPMSTGSWWGMFFLWGLVLRLTRLQT